MTNYELLNDYGKTGDYNVICTNDKCQASFILPKGGE